MLIHTSTHPKCGIVEFSPFHKKQHRFSIRTRWNLPFQLSCIDTHDWTQHKTHYSQAKVSGLWSRKMSSQVMEETEKNLAVKDHTANLPLSTSYETAMEALSSLITRQKREDRTPVSGKYGKLDRMRIYLKILDLEECIDGLNIIHVAGTKGKGSTCTFCEAILRECGFRTGLFTSPHLIDVRERFRIDGLDIAEEKFLFYFWDCYNRLKEQVTEELPMPPLFQFLAVLAFKIFVSEQVDVSIIEVGLGGKLDSTNVMKKPVVCGITSLGMDHTETLGYTLGEIAAHKAGIFKPQVPAFTVPQLSEAMDVLQEKACKVMAPLQIAAPLDCKKLKGQKLSLSGDHQFTNASLAVSLCESWLKRTGNWQKLFQNDNLEANLPEAFLRGLSTARLFGRAQIIHDFSYGDLTFYLDGAHSPESMEACAKWFSSAAKENQQSSPLSPSSSQIVESIKGIGTNSFPQHERRNIQDFDKISNKILLFNCMEVRDPQILLPRLVNVCASSGTYFSKAIFVPNMSTYNKVTSGASVLPLDILSKDLSWQFNLQRIWEKIMRGTETGAVVDNTSKDGADILPHREFLFEDASHRNAAGGNFTCSAVIPSLPLTIKWLRDCVRENPSLRVQVLVTGSLHLVGDVLKLLRR